MYVHPDTPIPRTPNPETNMTHSALTTTDRIALNQILSPYGTAELLQLLLQIRVPVRLDKIFVCNAHTKTAELVSRPVLASYVRQRFEDIQQPSKTIRRVSSFFAVILGLVGVAWSVIKSPKVVQEHAEMSGMLGKFWFELKKIQHWDAADFSLGGHTTVSVSFSSGRDTGNPFVDGISQAAEAAVTDGMAALIQKTGSGEYAAKVKYEVLKRARATHYAQHEKELRPGEYGLTLMVAAMMVNALLYKVLPRPAYVRYAKQAAIPGDDALVMYKGRYDGCLRHIDTRFHLLFERFPRGNAPQSAKQLRYALLQQSRGSRRQLELSHLVRADGTLRVDESEHARAIARTNTWTMYIGDSVHSLSRRLQWSRAASHRTSSRMSHKFRKNTTTRKSSSSSLRRPHASASGRSRRQT
jgi:hypothetical protein